MAIVKQYFSGIANGYFVIDEAAIAIDTGSVHSEAAMRRLFNDAGIDPQSIKLIIITHGHVDHFSNLPAMKSLTGAPVLCHREAAPALVEGALPHVVGRTSAGKALVEKRKAEGFPVCYAPKVTPDLIIDQEFDLHPWGINGVVLPTPGHSKGCISVVLDSGETFCGDLFAQAPNNVAPEPAYFTYPGGTDQEVAQSLQTLLRRNAQVFYSGHGGPFSRTVVEKALAEEDSLR